jgi:DNA mismatch repair protein MSH5
MDMVKPRPALAFGHMEVRIDRVSQQSQEQITYLYKSVELHGQI